MFLFLLFDFTFLYSQHEEDYASGIHDCMLDDIRLAVCSMCAQVHWNFLHEHEESWTVQLAKVFDVRTSRQEVHLFVLNIYVFCSQKLRLHY